MATPHLQSSSLSHLRDSHDTRAEQLETDLTVSGERIRLLRDTILRAPGSVCIERAELLREFARSREGKRAAQEHPTVRRALALRHVLSQRKPHIYDHELIVGNMSSKRVAANYYPEGASINVLEDIFRLEQKTVPLHLSAAERMRLVQIGLWGFPRSIAAHALLRPGRISHFLSLFHPTRYLVTEEAGVSHQAGGYEAVVCDGLRRIDERAAHCIATGRLENNSVAGPNEVAFFRSLRIAIEGISAMANHLAEACEGLAANPQISSARRAELLVSAAACRHVPLEPARTFLEGLQAVWLVHIALNMEDYEQGLSFGRLDQILWPLYQRDLSEGRLDAERATEMIASFQLKTCETMPLYSESVDLGFSGNTVGQSITLGGIDAQGKDATNALSGLFLDAFAQLRTREPNMQVRVHDATPDWFLNKAVEVVQLGCGSPALFGDAVIIQALEEVGVATPHARDYAVIGCVEVASPGRTYNSADAAQFNLALCLELALNEGHRFGDGAHTRRLGAATPPVSSMTSFDDVLSAFTAQLNDGLNEMAQVMGWLEAAYREHRTTPFNSMITEGCVAQGRDVTWGGALYDMTSIQAVGLADVGDSLYALNELVFETRELSLPALVDILSRDFEDATSLQVRLKRRFSLYGNGHGGADRFTALAADKYCDAIRAHHNTRGGQWLPGFYSMTCGTSFGKVTGALPNGRAAGSRLSNGYSPTDGADREGPSAMLRSAAALPAHRFTNGGALNLKFDARTVSGLVGREALTSLVRTYLVDQHGLQMQINVLDAETLRKARAHPEAFPHLLVRVSGYCAYFADLQPEIQDEIIERTAHGIA